MIFLKTLVEQQGMDSQYYDVGLDFFNFERSLESNFEQLKSAFEGKLRKKLVGKRVRIKGNKGGPTNRQEKVYTINVSNVIVDDYIDSYVITLVDNTDKKPKNYVVNTKFKIIILGQSQNTPPTEEPSTNSSSEPETKPTPVPDQQSTAQPPPPQASEKQPLKEGTYDFSISNIVDDIQNWVPLFLNNPESDLKTIINGIGKLKDFGHGITKAWYSLSIPKNLLNGTFTIDNLKETLKTLSKDRGNIKTDYKITKFDNKSDNIKIEVEKSTKDNMYE